MQVVDTDVAEKFRRFKENLENPNARQCPKCQQTQSGDPNQPIMTCAKCEEQYCFYHSKAHPLDERCEAYESRMLKEDKLNQEVTKDAKGCPRCKYLIEKNGGCNHMKVDYFFFYSTQQQECIFNIFITIHHLYMFMHFLLLLLLLLLC
ncbi:ariadne RING finger [Reticulomyxa filosa]|uniref:Ariadne RING finger n=1 Tax=Reticulomyxa filosa TaxID=46433 RepID=X6M6J3_RETFI|nr:ariadne RING finger [Reticulomyxa filosa]|eukprot:ETO09251.1 ariadne RING finger [Reticulomyxa filosa]